MKAERMTGLLSIFFFTILFQFCITEVDSKCPVGCTCKDKGIILGVLVECMYAKAAPKFWPERVQQINIYFMGSPIGGIPEGTFANLAGLRTIELKGNAFNTIDNTLDFFLLAKVLAIILIPIRRN